MAGKTAHPVPHARVKPDSSGTSVWAVGVLRHHRRNRWRAASLLWIIDLLLISSGCSGTRGTLFEPSESALAVPTTGDGAGGGPGTGDAGRPRADEALDPHASFDWTQTLPGQGTCKPGTYSGTFGCTLVPDANIVTRFLAPSGSVSLTLGPPNENQQLPVAHGELTGLYLASLQGALDCSSNEVQATSVDGRAIQLPGLMGGGADGFVTFPTFSATLQGKLDRATLVIDGSFEMISDTGLSCTGTFRANAMP